MKIAFTRGLALLVHGKAKRMRVFRYVKSKSRDEFNRLLMLARAKRKYREALKLDLDFKDAQNHLESCESRQAVASSDNTGEASNEHARKKLSR
jgi:hypothetical protein